MLQFTVQMTTHCFRYFTALLLNCTKPKTIESSTWAVQDLTSSIFLFPFAWHQPLWPSFSFHMNISGLSVLCRRPSQISLSLSLSPARSLSHSPRLFPALKEALWLKLLSAREVGSRVQWVGEEDETLSPTPLRERTRKMETEWGIKRKINISYTT